MCPSVIVNFLNVIVVNITLQFFNEISSISLLKVSLDIFLISLFHFTFTCIQFSRCMVGLRGLEPPTSRLSGVRSNHLSYKPMFLVLSDLFKPFGGDKRDRTADPLLARQVLSQLSYTPISLGLLPYLAPKKEPFYRTLKIKQQLLVTVSDLTLDYD